RLLVSVRAARRLLPGAGRRVFRGRPRGSRDRLWPRLVRTDRLRGGGGRRPAALPSPRIELRERRGPHRHGAGVGGAGAREAGHAAHRLRPPRERDGRPLPGLRRRRRTAARAHAVALSAPMSDRHRNAFVLALVTALVLVSLLITVGIPGAVKAQKTHL